MSPDVAGWALTMSINLHTFGKSQIGLGLLIPLPGRNNIEFDLDLKLNLIYNLIFWKKKFFPQMSKEVFMLAVNFLYVNYNELLDKQVLYCDPLINFHIDEGAAKS